MKRQFNASISIWMFCLAYLLNSNTAKADPYSESNWRVSYDNCSATITVSFWILDGRGEDDYFKNLSVRYTNANGNSKRIFRLKYGTDCSYCDKEFTRDGERKTERLDIMSKMEIHPSAL